MTNPYTAEELEALEGLCRHALSWDRKEHPVAELDDFDDIPPITVLRLIDQLKDGREPQRDDCQVCTGARGGVKGNENLIDGVMCCDYCHATLSRFRSLQKGGGRSTDLERGCCNTSMGEDHATGCALSAPKVTMRADATNPNCRRIHVDGSQWCKVYGFDQEQVEVRARTILQALSVRRVEEQGLSLSQSKPCGDAQSRGHDAQHSGGEG